MTTRNRILCVVLIFVLVVAAFASCGSARSGDSFYHAGSCATLVCVTDK